MAATGSNAKGLANIRHDKPEVPGEGEDAPPKVSSCDIKRVSTGSAKSAGASAVVGVTATFQSLINGLVQQHLVELAAAQGASGEDSIGVALPRQWSQGFRSASRKMTEPKAQQVEGKDIFGDRAHTSDMERLTSVDSAASSGSERRRAMNGAYLRSPTIGDVLCKKKDNLAQMNASKILEALEEDDEDDGVKSPASFAGDMKALFRHRGSMEDVHFTKSGDVKRYLQMSKSERATYWLTSTPYEMAVALILLLNVLWMALDLQIHGSMSGSEMGIGGVFLFESSELSDELIHAGDVFFAVIFAVDVVARIIFVGRRFWHSWPNYIDLAVSVTSIVELSLYYSLESPISPVMASKLQLHTPALQAFRNYVLLELGWLHYEHFLVSTYGADRRQGSAKLCALKRAQCEMPADRALSGTLDRMDDQNRNDNLQTDFRFLRGVLERPPQRNDINWILNAGNQYCAPRHILLQCLCRLACRTLSDNLVHRFMAQTMARIIHARAQPLFYQDTVVALLPLVPRTSLGRLQAWYANYEFQERCRHALLHGLQPSPNQLVEPPGPWAGDIGYLGAVVYVKADTETHWANSSEFVHNSWHCVSSSDGTRNVPIQYHEVIPGRTVPRSGQQFNLGPPPYLQEADWL
ncbi:Cacna1g [Symbiodinium sp. CCMP2592]|nr:Cacna1g [Symbiodinium sp. CCMP2592]